MAVKVDITQEKLDELIAVIEENKTKNGPLMPTLHDAQRIFGCIPISIQKIISKELGITPSDDTNAMLPQRLIYSIKDLRNSIAHNDVIFDTRFRTGNIDKQVSNAILNATRVSNVNFTTITDYLVLIIYIMKLLGETKTEMKRVINGYTDIVEKLRTQIPISVFNQIIYTDNNAKIKALKAFVGK